MVEPAFTGYLAPEEHMADMLAELGEDAELHGRLAIAPGPARQIAWVANVWHDPRRIPIASIADGARALRAIQRNWALYAFGLHRRASLIGDRLPHVSARPLNFPAASPEAPLGSWTLLDANTILASAHCSSPFPNGEIRFVEDRGGPRNRAYLKLWEALTIAGRHPGCGSLCLDLGSSPGGGLPATRELANLAAIRPGETVLDVGCGVGGPARVLAAEHGARVRAVDLAPAFIAIARALSQKSGISVGFEAADAL